METEDHKRTRTRLQDPEDFIPPYEKKKFERIEPFLDSIKEQIRISEEFFESGSERLGSVYASSGLRLSSSMPDSRVSVDWALLEIVPRRSSYSFVRTLLERNFGHFSKTESKFPSTNEAPGDFSTQFFPMLNSMIETQQLLSPQMPVFKKSRSAGFTMRLFENKTVTTPCSWKDSVGGTQTQQLSEDYRVLPITGLNAPGLPLFAQAGDSGSAVMSRNGAFVGLHFAGNDYSGA